MQLETQGSSIPKSLKAGSKRKAQEEAEGDKSPSMEGRPSKRSTSSATKSDPSKRESCSTVLPPESPESSVPVARTTLKTCTRLSTPATTVSRFRPTRLTSASHDQVLTLVSDYLIENPCLMTRAYIHFFQGGRIRATVSPPL